MIRGLGRLALLGLAVLAATVLAVSAAESWQVARHGAARPLPQPVDAVLVLGGGFEPDHELNWIGRSRVRGALALLERGDARVAIFTGTGCRHDIACSEAWVMRDFALAEGADPDRLIVEPLARTTLENLRFSRDIAAGRGFARLAVVTDAFHLTRAAALGRLVGLGELRPVAVEDGAWRMNPFFRMGLLLREALAWWLNAAKGAGWIALGMAGWSEAERGEIII